MIGVGELENRAKALITSFSDFQGRTPLHYAAALSRVDVSALLLDYGADATHKDTTSRTPLHYARDKKLDYVVALLSCHGNAVADFARVSRCRKIGLFFIFMLLLLLLLLLLSVSPQVH